VVPHDAIVPTGSQGRLAISPASGLFGTEFSIASGH
jgi:hypothetical protein